MTELRAAFSQLRKDGSVDMASLGKDMQRAEVVAMRLGNALPGTTEDFVQMMQVLKQNGLGIETILNGAADAVGNLAVASNAMPRELAADFAQFGNLFKLRAQDFAPAADVFSRIYSSSGQTSSELVEAAKYFQGRAGDKLGVGGLEDAERWTRLFGLMGKQGMRGSMAGMGLTNFVESYTAHRDKLDDLAKATGIKLDFFDDKGKFVGLEEVIRQMSQFQNLTAEDRSQWMETMFGTLGAGAGNILSNVEAWKKFNTEQDKTIGLAAKNAEVSKNFNNQLEALTGSLTNLVVTGFGPLLPTFTSAAQSANSLVGSLIDFGRANPTLTSTVAKLVLLGTTAVTVVGALKTLSNGFQLLKFAANFSSEDRAMSFFQKMKQTAEGAAPAVAGGAEVFYQAAGKTETASKRVTKELTAKQKALRAMRGPIAEATSGFKAYTAADRALGASVAATGQKITATHGKLSGLGQGLSTFSRSWAGQTIIATIVLEGVSIAIAQLSELSEREAEVRANAKELKSIFDESLTNLYNLPGDKRGRGAEDAVAKQFLNTIQEGETLMSNLQPDKAGWWQHYKNLTEQPYGTLGGPSYGGGHNMMFNPSMAARRWQSADLGNVTRDPNVLASVVRQLNMQAGEKGMTMKDVELITAAIEKMAGPEKWKSVLDILGKETGTSNLPGVSKHLDLGKPTQSQPFPSIRDLRNPWGIPSFNLNQPGGMMPPFMRPAGPEVFSRDSRFKAAERAAELPKPAAPAKPPVDPIKLFEMSKGSTEVMNKLNALNQPVATNVQNFSNLQTPVATGVTNFQNLIAPTADTAQAFGNLIDPARQMPGAFGRINSSVSNVAGSLDSLSVSIASWRPPATPGLPGGVTVAPTGVPGEATGAYILGSGLAMIHSNEEVVPVRTRAFRDTLGQNLVASLAGMGRARKDSVGGVASILDLTTVVNSDRTNNTGAGGSGSLIRELATLHPAVRTPADGNSLSGQGSAVGGQPIVFNYHAGPITINAPNADAAVEDFAKQLKGHRRELEGMMADAVRRANVRA